MGTLRARMGDRLDPSTEAKKQRLCLIKLNFQLYRWVEAVGLVRFFLFEGGFGWGVLRASHRTGRDGLPTLAAKPQRLGRGGRRVPASAGLGLHLPANGAEQVDGGTPDLLGVDFARGHR